MTGETTPELEDLETRSHEDLYPIKIVNAEGPVIGSCSTYLSRQCITPEIRANDSQTRLILKEVDEKVLVGGIRVVFNKVWEESGDCGVPGPEVYSSLWGGTEPQQSLEPIRGQLLYTGKNRQITKSRGAVYWLRPSPCFTTRCNSSNWGLLKKSITVYNKKEQNSLRRLFHLTRFYQHFQSKYPILTNTVANYLNNQPMKRQEISKTRQECGIDQKSFKKLYQCSKRFRVVALPYNEVYPDSSEREWYTQTHLFQGRIQELRLWGRHFMKQGVWGPPQGRQWVQGKALVGVQGAKPPEAPGFYRT
ncbi:uncharacterized protein LOC125678956 [Ostrea edulis]|uniref:uncharacterized protein LOC125678956 n=1 Tax=Ostrea edulis TaxID=37623 RepID=UPI0024AEFA14|nr:uncharacterized protein LOC125678956 [Ostrea edulis]